MILPCFRFDVGPIVNQMNLDIPSGVNCMQLSDLMARKGADLVGTKYFLLSRTIYPNVNRKP